MPEITSCPECEKKLRVPDDLLGKKVRCPGCGNLFVAKADRADEEEPEDEPPRKPKLSRPDGVQQGRVRGREREEEEEEPPRRRLQRDDEDEDRPRSRRRDEDEDEDDEAPRRRRRDEEDDDEYDDRPRGGEKKSWRGVRAGLNLVGIAGWLNVATVCVAVLGIGLLLLLGLGGTFAAMGGGPGGPPQRPGPPGAPPQPGASEMALGLGSCLFMCVMILLGGASFILNLIGGGMCMQTPSSRGSSARGLAVGSFLCFCGAILLVVIGFLIAFFAGFRAGVRGEENISSGTELVSQIFLMGGMFMGMVVSFLLWIFYLRAVCLQLRDSSAAGKVMTLAIAEIIYLALSVVLSIVMGVIGGVSGAGPATPGKPFGDFTTAMIVTMVLNGILTLVWIALYIWYVLTMGQVRVVVERHLARR